MPASVARELLADFIRDPVEAKAFAQDPDGYLSNRGVTIPDSDKIALKACVENRLEAGGAAVKATGHTNFTTHTNYNDSDGHMDRDSHTDHTSST